jgi:hypothetical protein
MDRRIILHIGQPKTGTTTIQKTLSSSRKSLKTLGVVYPKSRVKKFNHRFISSFLGVEDMHQGLALRMGGTEKNVLENANKNWSSVTEQINRSDADTVIISAEGLFRQMTDLRANQLLARLQTVSNCPVLVHAYIREPSSHYFSAMQQGLKTGRGIKNPGLISPVKVLNSYKKIKQFKLGVRAFDPTKLLNGDVFSDFIDWIGYPDLKTNKKNNRENTSISSEAMAVAFSLGAKRPPTNMVELKRHRQVIKLIKTLDEILPNPTKPILFPEIKDKLVRLDKDIIPLRDEYGLLFEGIDYNVAGVDAGKNYPTFKNIEEICAYDPDRRYRLEEAVNIDLAL